MEKILILGANGQIAQIVRQQLLADTDAQLKLFLRHASRLSIVDSAREEIIEGNANNQSDLERAMTDVSIVYANLGGGDIETQARAIVAAMQATKVKRLIWISTLGIYDEVPGAFGRYNNRMLGHTYLSTYAAAAQIIEESDLDYTIIRPAWMTNKDEVDYELTHRHEAFKGTEISRKSIAAEVVHLIQSPTEGLRDSLGINKPNTDGDKPAWE